MPFKVVPSGEEDAEILVPLGIQAFKDDLMNQRIYDESKASPEQRKTHLEWRIERHRRRVRGAGNVYFKAIDVETGEVAGYSAVMSPKADRSNTLTSVEGTDGGENQSEELKPPADTPKETLEFIAELEEKMKGLKKEALGEREDVWYVPSMAVHPKFQGRGIALRLLEHAFTIVDRAGQDLYLESTPAGRKLYQKAGFQSLATLDLMDGKYTLAAMIRKAKPQA